MKKAGIVILNYNNYQLLLDKKEMLNSFDCINEIIIVDNCSTNESYQKLKQLENEKIKVVEADKNGGYAYGNNYGLRILEKNNEYAFIMNPDIIVQNIELEKIINMMEKNQEYAILGAIRTVRDGNYSQRQFWNIPTFWDEVYGYIYILRKLFPKKEVKYIENSENILDVEVVPGCFFLMNMNLVKKVNYFDENTFLYYEENILAKKVKNLGYKSGIALNSNYIHDHDMSATKNTSYRKMKKYVYESKKYYDNKYLDLNFLQKAILNFLNFMNRLIRGIL